MVQESFHPQEHPSLRSLAFFMGASVVSTTALVTYALVKDSGATVAELGRDVWKGVKPNIKDVPEKISDTLKDRTASVVEICKNEADMLNHYVLRHFREDT